MSLLGSIDYNKEISGAIKIYGGASVNFNTLPSTNLNNKKSDSNKTSSLENKILSVSYKDDKDETDSDNKKSGDLEDTELGDSLNMEDFFRMQKEFIEQSMLYSQQQESIYANNPNPNEVYELEQEEEKYVAKSNSETMDNEEAHDAVEQMVTEAQLGSQNLDRLSLEDRRRFSNWQKFNKALLMLYHNTSSMVTSEVDYK